MSVQYNGKPLPIPAEWRDRIEDELDQSLIDGDLPEGWFFLTDERIDEMIDEIEEEEDHDHAE